MDNEGIGQGLWSREWRGMLKHAPPLGARQPFERSPMLMMNALCLDLYPNVSRFRGSIFPIESA